MLLADPDSGHLERAVATAGGQEALDAAVSAMLDDARGWRLAEMGDDPGAGGRVSQIDSGDVSTRMS